VPCEEVKGILPTGVINRSQRQTSEGPKNNPGNSQAFKWRGIYVEKRERHKKVPMPRKYTTKSAKERKKNIVGEILYRGKSSVQKGKENMIRECRYKT